MGDVSSGKYLIFSWPLCGVKFLQPYCLSVQEIRKLLGIYNMPVVLFSGLEWGSYSAIAGW